MNRNGVKYLVVGAHALAYHAKPRFTKDLDVLVEPAESNAGRVLRALDDFGFGSLDLSTADLAQPGRVIQLGYPPSRIDILTAIAGVDFDEAWSGRVIGKYGEVEVPYLGKVELLRNKRAAGRPQDLVDLQALEDRG